MDALRQRFADYAHCYAQSVAGDCTAAAGNDLVRARPAGDHLYLTALDYLAGRAEHPRRIPERERDAALMSPRCESRRDPKSLAVGVSK